MKKQAIILSCLLMVVLFLPFIASADVVTDTITNITDWIVKISLGVAILMYVIGGYFWVIDTGNMESVKMAKNIITSATIGLAIILIAKSFVSIVETLVVK